MREKSPYILLNNLIDCDHSHSHLKMMYGVSRDELWYFTRILLRGVWKMLNNLSAGRWEEFYIRIIENSSGSKDILLSIRERNMEKEKKTWEFSSGK